MKYVGFWTKERRPIHTYSLTQITITHVQRVLAALCVAVAKARGSRRNVLEWSYQSICMLYILHTASYISMYMVYTILNQLLLLKSFADQAYKLCKNVGIDADYNALGTC